MYVKLQPYRQTLVALRSCHKLAAKYFRPFPVLARVGKVAYRLQLPSTARILPVFHISQLKKHVGTAVVQENLPEEDEAGLTRLLEMTNCIGVYIILRLYF